MPQQQQPDLEAEVLQVYAGETLAEATRAAVDAHGPEVEIHRVRKVRRGVRGLVGKELYEVLVVAPVRSADEQLEPAEPPLTSGEGDPVAGALSALMDRADEIEERDAVRSWLHTDGDEQPVRDTRRTHSAAALPEAVPGVVPGVRHAELVPAQQPGVAGAQRKPPGWSRESLRELGIPAVVLDHLPRRDPRDDLQWLAALRTAIEAVVPAAVVPDAEHVIALSGYGAQGAVALIQAGVAGVAPGTLTVEGRTVVATATELSLAVRSCLVS